MAWCSRTSRDAAPRQAATGSIGPGSYHSNLGSIQKPKPGFAAFGSTDVKDAYTKEMNLNTPGPGAYNYSHHSHPVVETSSMFKSTSERTKAKTVMNTPGPGAYPAATRSAFNAKETTRMRRSESDKTPGNKVKWVRVPTAPSIPIAAQSFGYEQGPKGQMVLQKPITTHGGDALGPGVYDPLKALQNLSSTRAANFSKSRTTRDNPTVAKAAKMPGPGSYNPAIEPTPLTTKPSAVFKSSLTRDRAANPITNGANVPGPGAYNNTVGLTPQRKPEHLQFFGSTSSRFEQDKFAPPQPTPAETPHRYVPIPSSKSKVGFASTNPRFEKSIQAGDVVGPGSYEAPSLVQELQHRLAGRTGAFGSTTKRFESPKPQSLLETVLEQESSPVHKTNQEEPFKATKSSAFASTTDRFRSQSNHESVPCPGDYEISMRWDKPGSKAVFASHLDRSSYMNKQAANLPGPGSYSTPQALHQAKPSSHRKDVFVSAEPRFKTKLSPLDNVGPGAYNPDTIETDWNRPTYNITIATEMEKRI
ncbi:unnamed protein product [Aphanomyces euteiches]|uniref:Uncharacterized protein n=1 Tax=Aphanomyces euteiches TaxID=100861 RepID=A0A6G0WTN4_9STRA|nr:hypothetical protein Ae201684_011749 [Aphanomyces euteiches]KAH9089326.1 hypothetical protein Ae201684P_001526 [Aphanomyces euteiches]KAH9156120.1 hypothetical protein AeRB84_001940 [Aphanomyces euteiches]